MITKYVILVLFFFMFLSVVISPATAISESTPSICPTYIVAYGNDFHDGVFTVHTNDTGGKHNLKAQVHYINITGNDTILNPWHGFWRGFDVFFECWEKPNQDNNGNGVYGECLYTEKDRAVFELENEVNPAKWHKHGVPTGEYNIKIIFNELPDPCISRLGKRLYSASERTILFRLLP